MQISFGLFVFFSLTTPSWRYGSFAWMPLLQIADLVGGPMQIGIFNLLPICVVGSWALLRWQVGQKWQWGQRVVMLPMLALTFLSFARLTLLSPRRIFLHLGGWAIAWLVYLFLINEGKETWRIWVVSFILWVQGGVAVIQFFLQREVGLDFFGELPLNPLFSGVTVLFARNIRWLRAYGLTAHPNLLGAILAILLLILLQGNSLPSRRSGSRFRNLHKIIIGISLSVGLLGLFVSFSRSAWLGFGIGFLVWVWQTRATIRFTLLSLLPLLPLLFMLLFYHDLATSRLVRLETAVEQRSLNERLTDTQMAFDIIKQHPLWGIGMGNYADFAQQTEPSARRVHNVPLLITAELGIFGGLFWLILAFAPLCDPQNSSIPIWLAMIVMSQLDTMVWVSGNWQTAVLFALIAAQLHETR